MATAVLPVADVGSELATQAVDTVKEKSREFGKNPAQFIANALIKWGSVIFIGGIVAYVLSVASTRAARGYVTDIDNTLGIHQETPPTPARKVAPVAPPPPPPTLPLQVILFNQIVSDINTLGTVSASANVLLLQDVLTQLWALAGQSYGVVAGKGTQTPLVGSNPTGNATGLGPQLCIAIMQTCRAIFQLEGGHADIDLTSTEWTGAFWIQGQLYDAGGVNRFLSGVTATSREPFNQYGVAQWNELNQDLSLQGGSGENYKETLNGLAFYLNVSKPFDVKNPGASNYWGVLGTVVSDLGAIGAEIEQGAETAGSDIEGAVVQAGKDINGVVTEIGAGLALIGKAIVNFPRLLFDSLGYAGSWAGEMILDAIYLPLLAIGGSMVAAGISLRYVDRRIWPKLSYRLDLYSEARTARLWNWLDNKLGTREAAGQVWTQKSTEAAIVAAAVEPVYTQSTTPLPSPHVPLPGRAARSRQVRESDLESSLNAPPVIDAGLPAEPQKSEPPEVGGAVSPAEIRSPEEQPPEPPAGPSATVPPPEAPKPPETPVATPTVETEAFLGEHPSRAPTPDEISAAYAARAASMPVSGPSYAQRKEEREHAEAERLLAMGTDWDSVRTAEDAQDIIDRKRAAIKEAQADKRQATVMRNTLSKKPASQRKYRGAFETANQGLNPEAYGE
jgi:hypothetical protein